MKSKKLFLILAILSISFGCSSVPYYGKIEYVATFNSKNVEKIKTDTPIYVQKLWNNKKGGSPEYNAVVYGTLRGGFGEHLKDLYSNSDISTEITMAISNFLSQNGVSISDTSEQYLLNGKINGLWVQWPGVGAHTIDIDIDLQLVDLIKNETVWNGGIKKHQKGHFCKIYPEICDDENVDCFGYSCHIHGLQIYLNKVLSDELNNLWETGGLKECVISLR